MNKKEARILENSTKENVPIFSLENEIFFGKVVDVYDGDTCKVNMFYRKNEIRQFTIRMAGYDTPEKRTKDETEKKFALRATCILERLISGKIVKLECGNFDKYGRLLGTIFTSVKNSKKYLNINEYMVKNNFGVEYNGKTKKEFQELYKSGYYNENKIFVPETENVKYKKKRFFFYFC
jgi:micrococcal nuclease